MCRRFESAPRHHLSPYALSAIANAFLRREVGFLKWCRRWESNPHGLKPKGF